MPNRPNARQLLCPLPHALRVFAAAILLTCAGSSLPPLVPGASAQDADAAITVGGWNVGLDDADIGTIAAQLGAIDGVDLWGIAEVNRTRAVPDLEAAAEAGEPGDFAAVAGRSGDAMRLVALYDDTRFDLLEWYELDAINTTGNARAPLVLRLRDTTNGAEFLFMVNHLYRSREAERHKQAALLNDWAERQTLPLIAVGDYNFDWEVRGGETQHDLGYDLMTEGGAWEWVRPARLVTTQCSGWPCRYDSVLDFVFAGGPARDWVADSEIVVIPGDFPDDATTSDHRPVLARFWPAFAGTGDSAGGSAQVGAATPSAPPPAPVTGTVNRRANLRGGPGTNYPVVGGATAGQALEIASRNAAGDWLQLAGGAWIATFLVDMAPGIAAGSLPQVAAGSEQIVPAVRVQATMVQLPPPVAPVTQPAPQAPAVATATPIPIATPMPAPLPTVAQRGANCEPSYPTLCILIGSPDLDCPDIDARRFPVAGADPHRFDGDGNGVGCERD